MTVKYEYIHITDVISTSTDAFEYKPVSIQLSIQSTGASLTSACDGDSAESVTDGITTVTN